MSILSFSFVAFLILAMLVYFLTPGKYQWISLLVISYCFYLFSGVRAVIFILITTTTTYFAGRWIGKINDEFDIAVANYSGPNPKMTRIEKKALKDDEDKRKKRIMVTTIVINFGILIALKYLNPLVDLMNGICSLFHLKYEIPYLSVVVPLGISYYTFQAVSYIIDLYRRKYAPEKNFGHFMLYISFFPQLIQGPISRYNEFMPGLLEPHRFDFNRIKNGAVLSMWGLFKKLVIADRITFMTSTIFSAPETYSGFYLLAGMVIAVIRMYTDFSGGIDITRGVAEAFGIEMPENFTRPFFSISFDELWRRWHITLNHWFRDYVFYPLTLSRPLQKFGKRMRKVVGDNFGKKLPTLIAVIICRIFNAIWHGTTAASIVSGIYYGIVLALSFYFEPHIKQWTKTLRINTECFSWKVFQCVRTFFVFGAPFVLGGARTFDKVALYIRCLFKKFNPWILFDGSLYNLGVSQDQLRIVSLALLALLVVSAIQEKGYSVREVLDKQNIVFRGMVYLLLIFSIVLFGAYGAGYNASAFIYQLI